LVIEVFQASPSRGFGRDGEEGYVVWKAIGNIAALVGVLVAMAMMFNQVDGRLDCMQTETNPLFDRMQTDTNARFDAVLEAIMSFDRRVSRIERRLDAHSTGAAEQACGPAGGLATAARGRLELPNWLPKEG
jgi:hypothetical protein